MKIRLVGDLHGQIDLLNLPGIFDLTLQVGDLGAYPDPSLPNKKERQKSNTSAFKPYLEGTKSLSYLTYFIRGNHEDQKFLVDGEHREIIPNLWFIPDGEIIETDNLLILGFGGVYSSISWSMSWEGRAGKRLNHYSVHDFRKAMSNIEKHKDSNKFRIFLSHDAPPHPMEVFVEGKHVNTYYHGRGKIKQLVQAFQPDIARFGHYHYPYVYPEDTRWKILARGEIETLDISPKN